MDKRIIQIKEAIHYKTAYFKERVNLHLRRFWWKALALGFLVWFVNRKDLSVNVQFNNLAAQFTPPNKTKSSESSGTPKAVNTSMLQNDRKRKVQKKNKPVAVSKKRPASYSKTAKDDNLGNTYSNMTYSGAGFATRDSKSAEEIKRQKQLKYVGRFVDVAQAEMKKYGIPASITLAQGLLESNAGESRLAVKNNNHFGIKCFSRTCKKGHCSNFTDDTHKDFFRKYKSSWESYRGHSHLLRADRYKPLYKLNSNDYKAWARGLKKAGYATDKYYAEKLINLIEDLNLDQYDE